MPYPRMSSCPRGPFVGISARVDAFCGCRAGSGHFVEGPGRRVDMDVVPVKRKEIKRAFDLLFGLGVSGAGL